LSHLRQRRPQRLIHLDGAVERLGDAVEDRQLTVALAELLGIGRPAHSTPPVGEDLRTRLNHSLLYAAIVAAQRSNFVLHLPVRSHRPRAHRPRAHQPDKNAGSTCSRAQPYAILRHVGSRRPSAVAAPLSWKRFLAE